MIKAEVIEKFTLVKFDDLKNIVRKNKENNERGTLYVGDTFECDEDMAKYLTGSNIKNKTVIKIVEIMPEIKTYDAKVVDADKVEVKVIKEPKIKKVRNKKNK